MTPFESICRDGLTTAVPQLTHGHATAAQAWLASRSSYASHVYSLADWMDKTPRSVADTQATGAAHACFSSADVVNAPYLLSHGLSMLDFAAEYLGQEPVLYSMNAWCSFSTGPTRPDTQAFHRDKDDVKFLAIFTLLSDCPLDMAHLFVRGSHLTTEDQPQDGAEIIAIAGIAGTTWAGDNRGLHMGRKPTTGKRWITWARYGVSDPPASYIWDGIKPVEYGGALTDRERRVCRLIIK